jgi:hypothetical protein
MKKNNLALLVLVLLAGFAAYWFYEKKANSTSLEGYDFNFAVKDTASIQRILLADRQGHRINLVRNNKTRWTLNNTHAARPVAVNNLLETLERVEMKYRLPRNSVKGVVESIASIGIRVQVFGAGDKKIRDFYVGESDLDSYGTFMMMDGSGEPYATHIPNFFGGLRIRFFTEEIDWRDRVVIKYGIDDVQRISVDYPLQKSKSFKLENARNNFAVTPLYDVVPRMPGEAAKGLVENYITGFRGIGVEGFENESNANALYKGKTPFAVLHITNTEGKTDSFRFHAVISTEVNGTVRLDANNQATVERYFVEGSNNNFYTMQHRLVEQLFWAYESFFNRN